MSDYIKLQNGVWYAISGEPAQLPHALLCVGPEGIGKRGLAETLAARLLCETHPAPGQPACGRCPSCTLFAAGTHPDFRLVQPESESEEEGGDESSSGEKKKASKQIRIGQIRELEDFFNIGSHRGGARVCIIDPAESMNAVTANSLLKILEEPTASFYFLIISHRWQNLLPTIVSRCRRVVFPVPETAAAEVWLSARQLASARAWLPFFGNAPLALSAAAERKQIKPIESIVNDLLAPQDPLALAARWEPHLKAETGLSMETLVTTLQKWQIDLGLANQGRALRYLPQFDNGLRRLSTRVALPAHLEAQRQIVRMRRLSNHPLNPRLFLEDLCVRALRPLNS